MGKARARSKEWRFDVSLQWDKGRQGTLTAEGKPELTVATPPDFQGPEGVWSPEEMCVASVNSCMMTTFLYYADKQDFSVADYRSDAEGTVIFDEGTLRFSRIVVRPVVTLKSESDREDVEKALQLAESKCLVSNSLKADVEVEPRIELGDAAG